MRAPRNAHAAGKTVKIWQIREWKKASIGETIEVSRQTHFKESFTMDEYGSPSHGRWECEYHVVFIPKCRRKELYGQLRERFGVDVSGVG
jgi:hypothetical protein